MSEHENNQQPNEKNAQVIDLSKKREQFGVDEGIKWLRRAAHSGDIWSMTELAYLMLTGTKVAQDLEEGERWLRKAADAGDRWAMMELGYRLLNGQGLEQNIEEGEIWLQKAAESGEVIAMREWGNYLIHGLSNPPKN